MVRLKGFALEQRLADFVKGWVVTVSCTVNTDTTIDNTEANVYFCVSVKLYSQKQKVD